MQSQIAKQIDGKAVAKRVRAEVSAGISAFIEEHGRAPSLHVVLAGDDPASAVYVRNKEKATREVGMLGQVHRLAHSIKSSELLDLVQTLNRDPAVDGILVQLPLPEGLRPDPIVQAVDPQKDVDGLHRQNIGALWSGQPGLVPCTPRGCMRLLKEAGAELAGARALVVGRSNLVGKPIAALLLSQHATVTLAHSRTRDLAGRCREADVLIAAIGRARMIGGDWVKRGAVVIDVGINRGDDGKLCGDVDYAAASKRATAITPVPGGVGPMTIAMLLENTLIAAKARQARLS